MRELAQSPFPMTWSRNMDFDFDRPVERRGGDSLKWNRYAGTDVLPMWVADMDFAVAAPIVEALERRVAHGVFGYCAPWPSLGEAITDALARDHDWRVDPDWIVWLPGLVSALNVVCRAIGQPGEAVLTATPIYPPFLSAPRHQQRIVRPVDVRPASERWSWDWDALEAAARRTDPPSRLLLLCNPHNPTGRVLTRPELERIGALCVRHDLVLCSDEVHCGLVLDEGLRHLPIAALDPDIARRSITLMAASKTFNLPGLGCAFAVIPDGALRARVLGAMRGIVAHVNALGLVATEAAYRHGEPWRHALLAYLRRNRAHLGAALAQLPGLQMSPPQATYLGWIDARGLGEVDAVRHFERAGVGLSDGREFGAPGFVRLNFGCTRATLDEALRRMAQACAAPR